MKKTERRNTSLLKLGPETKRGRVRPPDLPTPFKKGGGGGGGTGK